MSRNNTTDAFGVALQAVLARAAERVRRGAEPDFGRRRLALASFAEVPRSTWATMREQAGLAPRIHPTFRRLGAAWLWTDMTAGMTANSPELAAIGRTHARQMYRDWLRMELPALRAPLSAYGRDLLTSVD